MNIENHCRICLYVDDKHVDVLENENINKKIKSCLSVTVTRDDCFPKGICTECVNMLCQFYDFQEKAKTSEQFFRNVFYSNLSNFVANNDKCLSTASSDENLSLTCNDNTTDSLIKFLTKTGDIDPQQNYINEDGKISTLVNYLEDNNTSLEIANKLIEGGIKVTKITSMKNNNELASNEGYEIHMEIDVLESDEDIVREILLKDSGNPQSFDLQASDRVQNINKSLGDKNKIYSCLACKKVFHDISILTSHMQGCKRTCLDCDLLFDTQQKLKQHRLFHRPELDQVCEQCGKNFTDKISLHQHIQNSHTDFASKLGCVYRCRQCGELFEERKDLYFHAKKHIQNNVRNKYFECEDCSEKFSNKISLDSHKTDKSCNTILPSDVPCVYRCKVCMTLFTDRKKLYLHVKKHCDQGPQLCDHCGKSYANSTALNRHVLTHVGKKFQCQNCLRNFADNVLLEKHLLLHARTDSFICEMCGITFKKQDTLFTHIGEKHGMSSVTLN